MRSSKQKGTNAMITSAEFGIFLLLFPITGVTLWLVYQLWLKRNENTELKAELVEVKDKIENLNSDTMAAKATKNREAAAEVAEAAAEAAEAVAKAKAEAAAKAKAEAAEAKVAAKAQAQTAEEARVHAKKHPYDIGVCRFPEGGCGKM